MGTGRAAKRKGTCKSRASNRGFKRTVMDLKNRGKDIDRIQDEVRALAMGKRLVEIPGIVDEDAPGGGAHYCVVCARHHISAAALTEHKRTKGHKKRLGLVAADEYTQADADAAAGMAPADTKSTREVMTPAAALAILEAASAAAGAADVAME